MYITSVNEAYALDARSGRQIWHTAVPARKVWPAMQPADHRAWPCSATGVHGPDTPHLIALHRDTGKLLWDVEMADARQNYGATGAPLVVNTW